MYRPTKAYINLQAIQNNYRTMKEYIHPKKVAAIIKANAYGHGIEEVAKALVEADMFGVATIDEALFLREKGIENRILVIGWTPKEAFTVAAEKNIEIIVYDDSIVTDYKGEIPLGVHIKVDTGMNRLGVKTKEEYQSLRKKIEESSHLSLQGVSSHFATADEPQSPYIHFQQIWWKQIVGEKKKEENILYHVANSAYGWKFGKIHGDMVRMGISLYGYTPSDTMFLPKLEPAFTLKSAVSHCKKIGKGERIGYGATYEATETEEWIATIPIGYADGILRRYGEKGEVLLGGKRCKIVGRICMDQLMIKCEGFVETGEEVVFIGKQGEESITLEEMADRCHTIHYEILCNMMPRIERVYI